MQYWESDTFISSRVQVCVDFGRLGNDIYDNDPFIKSSVDGVKNAENKIY